MREAVPLEAEKTSVNDKVLYRPSRRGTRSTLQKGSEILAHMPWQSLCVGMVGMLLGLLIGKTAHEEKPHVHLLN